MNILNLIRERIAAMLGLVVVTICFAAMGAFLAFYVSPQQALEWRRINALPEFTPALLDSAAPGADVVFTGTLTDNPALVNDLVAYQTSVWEVSPPDNSNDSPDGSWQITETVIPALQVSFQGAVITTVPANSARLGGQWRESIEEGSGSLSDSYNNRELPDGSIRTVGFANGDLVTVFGQKASTGGVIPAHLFGGDRIQLVDSVRQGARTAFLAGISFMACSPLMLLIGGFAILRGRARGGINIRLG